MTNQNIVLPSIELRGTTILPGMIVHFDVSRERSIKAIEAAMLHDQKIFLVTQKDPEVETPDASGVYQVGTSAYSKQVVKLPQILLRVLVEGIGRGLLVKFEQEFPFLRSEITPVDEESIQMPEALMEAMHRSLKELFHRYCMENGKISKELVTQILNIEQIAELVEQIAVNLPLSYQNKQKILEALTLEERYEVLGAILSNEIEIMQIGRDLQKKVKARVKALYPHVVELQLSNGLTRSPTYWELERLKAGGGTNGQEHPGSVHGCMCTDQRDRSRYSGTQKKKKSRSRFC